jgi:hypothetical protein
MSTFSFEEADNYGKSNSGSFFQLKNDKDTARVRFLYGTMDDVKGYSVHRVAVGDSERYVNCLRKYNDPIDKCPFCNNGMKPTPRLFVKLFNEDTQEVQTWERGKTFFQKLSGLAARYNPMHATIFEIIRNGKPKDMQTTYDIWPTNDTSDFNIEDTPVDEPLGTIILDKTAAEMEEYLATGSFPSSSADVANARQAQSNNDNQEYTRRTPGTRAF